MAFLCPVRIRRGKKKKSSNNDVDKELSRPGSGLGLNHGMGRITGSASIETLVRVGIEKEHGLSPDSKMVVLHDFTPCVDDELEVKRGQIVNILYRENDWVYVIGQDTRQEGFIPHSYCAPYNTQLADLAIKKKLPRDQSLPNDLTEGIHSDAIKLELLDDPVPQLGGGGGNGGSGGLSNGMQSPLKNSQASLSSEPDFLPFAKDPSGRYIVLYTFIARDENDVSVERGEFVTVLNREDPDWYWIVRSDGQEGFIPSGFVYPADSVLQSKPIGGQSPAKHLNPDLCANNGVVGNNNNNNPLQNGQIGPPSNTANAPAVGGGNGQLAQPMNNNCGTLQAAAGGGPPQQLGVGADDLRYHGTELVMLYDYKAQAPDDLSVRRGDWIYADLNNQTVDGWLWAYAPKTRKYGFIPKAYARPPAMTSL
ncbi:SH3 domain-containing protein Dlish [Episyrphus balteatus]|uniref:SH3 domain-containing protein Dlish n=1 Tax=Episyrphus balteatus TaxID=286459 RepID=UPI002486A91A|nr:SH3 domain-containing protein Dlish [Episyrphus balteatus]